MSVSPLLLQDARARMEKSIEVMLRDFATVRTGRAHPAVLEGLKVDYYGNPTPLLQLARVGIPDARTLEIKPYDPGALPAIERAVFESNVGLTPVNDGLAVRISFPPLTEERRRELVKVVKKMAEDARIAARSIRRETNEKVKASEKAKQISEDEAKDAETQVQKITDTAIARIDELARKKETELLEI